MIYMYVHLLNESEIQKKQSIRTDFDSCIYYWEHEREDAVCKRITSTVNRVSAIYYQDTINNIFRQAFPVIADLTQQQVTVIKLCSVEVEDFSI